MYVFYQQFLCVFFYFFKKGIGLPDGFSHKNCMWYKKKPQQKDFTLY